MAMVSWKKSTLCMSYMASLMVVIYFLNQRSLSTNGAERTSVVYVEKTKTLDGNRQEDKKTIPKTNNIALNGQTRAQTLIEWSIHPKTFCFGNPSSEIALASLGDITDSVLPDLTQLSRLNKGYYAIKYNYTYCEFAANTEIGRNPVYSKASILLNVLKLYKYAIWIDFDIIAQRNSRSFDHLLNIFKQNSAINGILTSDMGNHKPDEVIVPGRRINVTEDTIRQPPESNPPYYLGVNTGIQLYRSCNWTFHFIYEWYSYFRKADDQQAIFWHYYEHTEEWNKHMKVVKYSEIELITKQRVRYLSSKNDDHLLHLAGGKWTWEKKQYIMKELILKHTDGEALKQYKKYKRSQL
eukprot:937398_1